MSRIEDHTMMGDLHTAALVATDGSIDWLCRPHLHSAACFAARLDEPKHGRGSDRRPGLPNQGADWKDHWMGRTMEHGRPARSEAGENR